MKVKVTVRYDGNTVELEGGPREVYESLQSLFKKILPTYELAREMLYSVDVKDLVEILRPYVVISEEGDIILTEAGESLSMSNKILSVLIAARLLKMLGKRESEYLTLNEIASIISASPKSTSSRLSELHARGYVERGRGEEGVRYRVSLKGIMGFQRKTS
ncbi:hypothetical protein B6U99_00180 [Candidatus Geothermarchaeota archaeon ex4572_27]|nr:MAG: hypothetical protein B6U99_00180 [Candidatus Geothermarchaeota archaeon ex4572_27]